MEKAPLEIEIISVARKKRPRNRPSTLNSEAFKYDSKGIPTALQLKEFERDPIVALLAMALNSGQSRFAGVRELNESTTEERKEIIEELIKEIDDNYKVKSCGRIVDDFQSTFDKNAPLFGCACCGIREFQMGGVSYHQTHVRDLDVLRMNEEKIALYSSIPHPYKLALSVYISNSGKKSQYFV